MSRAITRGTQLLVRMRWATILAFIAVSQLGSAAADKPRRSGMKKATKTAQSSFEAVLDAQKPAIVGCVMTYGINRGAAAVTLDFKVLINRQGHVFNMDLKVTGGDTEGMSACVKQALNDVHFPASSSALTELRRQWTFATT